MGSVSIRAVRTRRELKRFVKVPFRLHRAHPQWVAPLVFERMEFLSRKKNPWFEHAEAEFFIAERDGEPVGRISAQVDHRWDEYQGGGDAMFGFFETSDDREVAVALIDAAAEWAAAKGRARILGHVVRILIPHINHCGADFNFSRLGADRGQKREWRSQLPRKMMNAKIRSVQSQALSLHGEVNGLQKRVSRRSRSSCAPAGRIPAR